jgi:hypothetical protein
MKITHFWISGINLGHLGAEISMEKQLIAITPELMPGSSLHFTISVLNPRQQKTLFRGEHNGPGHFICVKKCLIILTNVLLIFQVPLEGEDLDRPLYDNADITLKEALIVIVAFVLSEGTTSSGLDSLLKLLSALLPRDSILPDTKYLFNKVFSGSFGTHQYKLYCPTCENFVNVDTNDTNIYSCDNCQEQYQKTKLMEKGNFFIYLPIAPQLARLLQRKDIGSNLSYRFDRNKENPDAFSDIYDGDMYRSLGDGALLRDPTSISLTFSTDGLPIFHSSNYAVWPLQAIVNELPSKLRTENVLLFGLWFGPRKPHMNVFLEPFAQEMTELHETGFNWINQENEVISSHVYACAFPCDSIARCQVQNIKQFNGVNGCSWCFHPGQVVPKGNGFVRSYTYMNDVHERTHASMMADAVDAVEAGDPVNGVKGPSNLMQIPEFDMVKGFVVDNLHCVDLGISRQLANLWLEPSNNQQEWYIGTRVTDLDKRLALIHPPYEITRLPRSLSDRKHWKGSEWHFWLLQLGIPVLRGILPVVYLKHLMLLVEGIQLLSQTEIKVADIERADVCLNIFVSQFGMLYGAENVTYNVHQLLHIADSVKNWGPLWCYSTYIFEGYMQTILKLFHGTQAVPLQIVNRFSLWSNLMSLSESIVSSDNTSIQVRHYLKQSLYGLPLQRVTKIGDATMVGKGIRKVLDAEEIFIIERLLQTDVDPHVVMYKKVICNGLKVGSIRGQLEKSRRQNHTVLTRQKKVVQIICYVSVRKVDGGVECIALGHSVNLGNHLLRPLPDVGVCCNHIREYEVHPAKVACYITDVFSKCSIIDAANGIQQPICCLHPRHQLTT